MGDYTTDTKVRQLYPALNDLSSLTYTQVEFFISQAEAEINGRLAARYALPFSAVPPLVAAISTEYALLKLMDRFFSAEAPTKNDWKEVRRKELKELLAGIADGTVLLVNASGAVLGQSAGATIESDTSGYTPTFNHLNPVYQEIDSDRLDDEEDAVD